MAEHRDLLEADRDVPTGAGEAKVSHGDMPDRGKRPFNQRQGFLYAVREQGQLPEPPMILPSADLEEIKARTCL